MVQLNQTKLIRVLVVEDKEDDFHYIKFLLRKNTLQTYAVDWASSFEEGLAALRRREHDVGLFDHQLGSRTGVDLLREATKQDCTMPIILLTGNDSLAVDQEAAAAGAADYLCKVNLDAIHLERAIRYALRHAEMVAALRESQSQLQLFMRNVPCAVCIQNERGEFLFRNEEFTQHIEVEELARARKEASGDGPWQYANGQYHWLVTTFPMRDEKGRELQGLAAVNITERVRAEEELLRTTHLLNGILTSLPVIASRVDEKGVIRESRGRGLEALGAKDGYAVGANIRDIYPKEAPDIEKAVKGASVNFVTKVEKEGRAHYFDSYFRSDESRGRGAIGFAVNITARVEAEAVMKRQSQLLKGMMKNLPIIVGRLDREGRVIDAEGSGLAVHGMTPEKMAGKKFAELYPQSREAVAQALKGKAVDFTLSGRHEDEEWQADFFVFSDPHEEEGAIFFGRDITERKWLEKKLLGISEDERRRIGADLHDGLGQHLTGIACMSTALRDRLKAERAPQAENADVIARLVNEAIDHTRALARGLCPVQLEKTGLHSALEDLTYQVQSLHRVVCQFKSTGPVDLRDPTMAIHLYRITQEAINNALRHGGARRVVIKMDSTKPLHRLTIEDDGCGFDIAQTQRAPGVGLRLMSYRAAIIGGSFKISPKPRGGVRVECTFTNTSAQHENKN